MGLADAAERSRVNMDGERKPKSKVDALLERLAGEESALLLGWLEDPENWSSHMIEKTLNDYSKEQGKDFTCGHSTIERWRMLNDIPVRKR